MKQVLKLRDKTLEFLSGKLDGFYLAGGTALSLCYFQHRDSFDIDLFMSIFNSKKIKDIVLYLEKALKKNFNLREENLSDEFAKMLIYFVPAGKTAELKIDFIEDYYELIKPLAIWNGIPVLSLEDIYFRKILAMCGSYQEEGISGKKNFSGGRQEAKDFFDIYHLSKTFMPLSEYVHRYCELIKVESLIIWHQRYDRLSIRTGLVDIITHHDIDCREIERHFKIEIDKIAEGLILE